MLCVTTRLAKRVLARCNLSYFYGVYCLLHSPPLPEAVVSSFVYDYTHFLMSRAETPIWLFWLVLSKVGFELD